MRQLVGFIITLLFSVSAAAQGCSDAGFCTIPSFSPQDAANGKFKVELRASLEGSEPGALIISPQLWLNYAVSESVKFNVKVPFWFVNDAELGKVTALSDPIISASFRISNSEKAAFFLTGGFRFGVGNATNKGLDNTDLPMDYQPTLGTTDIIIGANVKFNSYSASVGLQYPAWQYNKNQNVVQSSINNPLIDPIPLEYYRKADIMARLDRTWQIGNWQFKLGLLPIYHLANDELLSSENTGYITIEGSQGLTLNIPFGSWYKYNNWTFGLDGGFPVVTRDARPDGLTRRFVLQPRIALTL